MNRESLFLVLCLSFFFPFSSNAQNDLIKNAKVASIGISDAALFDKYMKTMPKVGSNARDLLLKQNIKPYMMPIREIGFRGTEMTYALAICLEYYINLGRNYKANLSPDYISLSLKNAGKRGTTEDGLNFLVQEGTVSAAILPYDADMMTNAVYATQKYTINNYLQMFRQLTKPRQKVFETRKALMRGNPVVIEVLADESLKNFNNKRYLNSSSVAKNGNERLPLIVVGYDEDQQAFEVMSVWGSNWGNDGYVWMKYSDFGNLAENAFVMIPQDNY